MNNPILSVNIGDFALSQLNRQPGGTIEQLPASSLGSLNINDVLTLEFIQAIETDGSPAKVRVSINGQPPADLTLNVRLEALPKEINTREPFSLQVKISSLAEGKAAFRIISFNGRPVEAPSAETAPVQFSKGGVFPVATAPVRLSAAIEHLAGQLDLSSAEVKQITNLLPNAELNFIPPKTNRTPTSNQPETIQFSPATTPEQPTRPGNVLENFIQNIKNIITSDQPPQAKAQALIEAFSGLTGTPLPAKTVSYPQSTVLSTPLGNLYPETAVKLPESLVFETGIKDVVIRPEAGLKELLDSRLWHETASLPSLSSVLEAPSARPAAPAADDTLSAILRLLRGGYNNMLQQLNNKIPDPGRKDFISNLVNFVKAGRSHDISDWLGKALTAELGATSAEGVETLNRLNNFVQNSTREIGLWRMVEIPVMSEAGILGIRLAVKRQSPEDEEPREKTDKRPRGGTRFVIDSSFTRLGKFQFDGISFEHQRRFDLIIRTEKYLDDDLCANIMRLFKTTLHAQDYTGVIKINRRESFIKPWEEELPQNGVKGGILV